MSEHVTVTPHGRLGYIISVQRITILALYNSTTIFRVELFDRHVKINKIKLLVQLPENGCLPDTVAKVMDIQRRLH